MPRYFRAFVILFICAWQSFAQTEPRRLALLLGNAAYQHLPPLTKVPSELDALSGALKGAGFDVTIDRDFTLVKGKQAVLEFLAKIQPGDVCFVYFDGYAMQSQQENFLLPVEFDPTAAQQDVFATAFEVIGIQQSLDVKKAGLKVIALEASRSDPRLMTQGVGLANPELSSSREILFAFSARPGQLPQDNGGAFTRNLSAAIQKKGLTILDVFNEVQKDAPTYVLPSVTKEFYFHAKEKVPDPIPPPPTVITRVERGPGTLGHNSRDKEDYAWIPPGTFKMGCVPSDKKCKDEETPQHQVTISTGFWMGRNEVKTLSYERYVDADRQGRSMPKNGPNWDLKWKLKDSQYPMAELTADEASSYCTWAGGRLPTEAEWEYAARAGETDKIYPFSGAEDSREQANFFDKKGNDKWDQAAPVGSFNANAWGLLDMAGNVWEWCLDKFGSKYYRQSPAVDPQGPDGDQHVVRGGSWDSDPKEHLRISFRRAHNAGNNVGFRCVLPDSEATRKLLQVH